jgi:hypothetical protein
MRTSTSRSLYGSTGSWSGGGSPDCLPMMPALPWVCDHFPALSRPAAPALGRRLMRSASRVPGRAPPATSPRGEVFDTRSMNRRCLQEDLLVGDRRHSHNDHAVWVSSHGIRRDASELPGGERPSRSVLPHEFTPCRRPVQAPSRGLAGKYLTSILPGLSFSQRAGGTRRRRRGSSRPPTGWPEQGARVRQRRVTTDTDSSSSNLPADPDAARSGKCV